MSESFRTIGVYVPPDVVEVMDEFVYDEAGVKDIRSYIENGGRLPEGDPGAEVMDVFMREIVRSFDELYEGADWEAAFAVDPNSFELVTVAAEPDIVYSFREKVEAARTLQECDSRTVHTAIFRGAVSEGVFETESVG